MKITVDGHGGHMCEAHCPGTKMAVGSSVEEAIGSLIRTNPELFGLEIEILPCNTSAYQRSGLPRIIGQRIGQYELINGRWFYHLKGGDKLQDGDGWYSNRDYMYHKVDYGAGPFPRGYILLGTDREFYRREVPASEVPEAIRSKIS